MATLREKGCHWDAVRIPESCRGVDIVIGIDEAGRGPVLGSLIYTAAFWPASEDEAIRAMGFDDSKQLKEGERDRLLEKIIAHPSIGWVVEELDAVKISEEMLQAHPASLNAISYDAVIRCLQTISSGGGAGAAGGQLLAPCVTDIFIDTVGDPETYKQRLTSVLGEAFGRFVIEKKADAKYKVVSAASIIAKVTRDTLLRAWQWKEQGVALDKDFGSGYPGDDTCVRWVERARHPVFGFPNLVRFSWSTVRESLIKGGAAKVHWDCDEEDDAAATHKMTSFFSSGASDSSSRNNTLTSKRARSAFFGKRKLRRLSSIADLC